MANALDVRSEDQWLQVWPLLSIPSKETLEKQPWKKKFVQSSPQCIKGYHDLLTYCWAGLSVAHV